MSVRAFMAEEVSPRHGDLVLLLGCFVTGLLDSAVLNVWSCFASMQTGNTVYVGLGMTGQPHDQPWRWVKSGTSIASFIFGSFLFANLMRRLSPLRRSTMFLSSLLQALLTVASAALVSTGIVPLKAGVLIPHSYIVLLPLTLLAMQSGGQCVLSRILGYGEIPTVVLTAAYCDVGMDKGLFKGLRENEKRNRRIASACLVIAGAGLGGLVTQSGDVGLALWICSALKAAMALAWLGWKKQVISLD